MDCPCFVFDPKAWICAYFQKAVLPLNHQLKQAIEERHTETPENKPHQKPCARCGQRFTPSSNRQKYCPSCKRAAERQRNAASHRARYQNGK
ncbi:MAG: hypothetical protein IJD39_05765 [Clostridia bacterium]|nr:hypothetical protein [Clostridia bacterium]